MNTEELTKVLTLIESMADDGKTAFIWYLCVSYGVPFLQTTMFCGMVYLIARLIAGAVTKSKIPASRLEEAYRGVRNLWLYDETALPPGEAHRMWQILDAAQKEANNK